MTRIHTELLNHRWHRNPGGEYKESIATLWRDLETLYGTEGVVAGGSRTQRDDSRAVQGERTGLTRGFTRVIDLRQATVMAAVRLEPSLLNPQVSNRFTFARSKAALVRVLGTEAAAIDVMRQDPSVLQLGEEVPCFIERFSTRTAYTQ